MYYWYIPYYYAYCRHVTCIYHVTHVRPMVQHPSVICSIEIAELGAHWPCVRLQRQCGN